MEKLQRNDYKLENQRLSLYSYQKNDCIEIYLKDIDFIDVAGDGANGVVIQAYHKNLRRREAIKFWLPNPRSKNKIVDFKQYQFEIEKLAKLNHPNIVQIFDADNTNGFYYTRAEWVHGQTLHKWLEGSPSINKRSKVLYLITQALKVCHLEGVYHGDLHRKNIMVTLDQNIKILDFGTSFRDHQYSLERDSTLILETGLEILLEEQEKYHFLTIKSYNPRHPKGGDDDVRWYSPESVVKSLESLNMIIWLLENSYLNDEGMKDLAEAITSGPFLNIKRILEWIFTSVGEQIYGILVRCLDYWLEKRLIEDIEKKTEILYSSIEVYYGFIQERQRQTMVNPINIYNIQGLQNRDKYIVNLCNSILKDTSKKLIDWILPEFEKMNMCEFDNFLSNLRRVLWEQICSGKSGLQLFELRYQLLSHKYVVEYLKYRPNNIEKIVKEHEKRMQSSPEIY